MIEKQLSAWCEKAAPHSDMHLRSLVQLAQACWRSHVKAPGGITVEIGTRAGGSAWLCLQVLDALYQVPPLVLSVDPYGYKAYPGIYFRIEGMTIDVTEDVTDTPAIPYGDRDFVAAKQLLSTYPNHAQFYLRSQEFLKLPLPEITFCILDGEHIESTVIDEISTIWPKLKAGGMILIDNADNEPGRVMHRFIESLSSYPASIAEFTHPLSRNQWQIMIEKPGHTQ